MKHIAYSFLFLSLVASSSAQELRSDINLSDPFIRADAKTQQYYMTGTGGGLWRSSNLETWTYLGFPLQFNESAWMGASPQVWASEIHYIDGKYYNFSTLTNGSITIDSDGHPRRAVHIMSSTLPQGKYSLISGGDDTYVPAEKTTLDATYFEDTDGRRYLLYCHEWIQNGNGTIEYIELKPDMTGAIGKGVVMTRAHDATWNTSPVTDGPYLFRTQTGRLGMIWTSWHGGRYVQGVAYSTTGTLAGPWQHEPLPITPDNYGHGMLFRTFGGQLLMSIHSHRTIDESKQLWERHPALFVMDDSGDKLRTIMEYKMDISATNPTRVMVDNPEFEYGKLGWKCTTGAQNQLIATNQSGAITGNFFESWDANSFTGEIYQELVVPNGTYRLAAAAFRSQLMAGGKQDAESVYLFANDEKMLVNMTTPTTFYVTVYVSDGRLRFGLRSEKKNFRWMGIDNVSIMYYGTEKLSADEIDRAQRNRHVYLCNLRDSKFLNAGQSWGTQAILDSQPLDLHFVLLPDGKYAIDSRISNGSLDHYVAANGYMDGTLTPFTIKDRGLSDAGRRIITLTADGTHYWGSTGGKTVSTQLTSASLKGAAWEVLTYDDLLATLSDATPANPADATFLIQCPGFGRNDTRISAWLGAALTLGGDAKNQCAEAPSGKFDVHQTLTDIPNGVYELTAQGFSKGVVALLYANNTTQKLHGIADENVAQPTDLNEASACFTSGKYLNTLRVNVTDGKLTLGVRCTSTSTTAWTVFDNFRLHYLGTAETVGFDVVKTFPGQVQYYDLSGHILTRIPRQHGIIIKGNNKYLVK